MHNKNTLPFIEVAKYLPPALLAEIVQEIAQSAAGTDIGNLAIEVICDIESTNNGLLSLMRSIMQVKI